MAYYKGICLFVLVLKHSLQIFDNTKRDSLNWKEPCDII